MTTMATASQTTKKTTASCDRQISGQPVECALHATLREAALLLQEVAQVLLDGVSGLWQRLTRGRMLEEERAYLVQPLRHLEFPCFGYRFKGTVLTNQLETGLRTYAPDSGVEVSADHDGEVDQLLVGNIVLGQSVS